ncbi:LLM class F420-dependent oxidoreductase [Allorhizocola rhizosphaerae]|uniref:LLM class F420-dependent oxidoreductase n=1 Tax=Allorhizocola rhizosphaerae TaxID=1872709 RepID=UPI000E3E414C|nr:LLM class F420-dependent oxidoreductase [Allorhizocola rhizosphaerae]
MRIGMMIGYAGGFDQAVAEIVDYEKAGLDMAVVPEAYSFDAVSQLGFIAARTQRLQLASGIMQIYTRTPTLTAMTAAGLDYVSGGRFNLGLGASGPQVIEGFHGVPYDAPLGRTREIVEICRKVWRREVVVHHGKHYRLPLDTPLAKPLKLINTPVRERIPVILAAVGPKNVELAAEIAEGWQPLFFYPEKSGDVWKSSLDAGLAKRQPGLGPLDIMVNAPLAVSDDDPLLDGYRAQLALYIGGMGAREKNFSNDVARRYGFEKEAALIQELYLSGRKAEAIAAVPEDLVRHTSLVGPKSYIADRIAAYRAAGVTTLQVTMLAPTHAERVRAIETLRAIVS